MVQKKNKTKLWVWVEEEEGGREGRGGEMRRIRRREKREGGRGGGEVEKK